MIVTSENLVQFVILAFVISRTESASLTLTASEPVVYGREVNLTCYSTNTMPSVVQWYRGDTYIGEENYVIPALRDFYSAIVIQTLLSYRLKIFTCDYARDNTTWSCELTGLREYLDLHVKVPVSNVTLEVIPANADVVSGEDLTFTCTTNPIDPQATIAWYVDGNPETGGSIAHDGPGLVATIGTLIYTTADSDRNHQVYCTAGNVDTVIKSTTTKMDVKIPVGSLTLSVHGQSGSMVTVNAGYELSFKCLTGDIYPQATIVWFVSGSEHTDDTSISDSNTDPIVTTGTLRYTTSSADNNEEVYCTAVSVGSVFTSNKITMDVRYNPPNHPSITDLSSPRFDGVQTTVTCTSVGGNPRGSLTMTCVAPGEQGSSSDDGTTVTYVLTLTPTPALDGEQCACTRTGTIGGISSDVGNIEVYYSPPNGPVMSGVVTTGHLYENYPTIVTCTSEGGNPLGDLTLFCPNVGTIGSSSVRAVTTATLNIALVPRSLNGLACTCDRTNANETPSTNRVSVIASVYYPPSAPSISQPGPWLEKSTQTLTCVVAVPGNPPTHFQWTRGTSIMGNNAVRPFPSVDKSENGETFTCSIENDFTVDKQQHIDPAFVILNVQYGPSVSTSGDEFTFTEGDPATVITTIDANPPAIQFAWIKSGEKTASSNAQHLTFNIISRQHAGLYTLSATNYPEAVGSAGMTGNVDITIVVNYAPNVTVSVTDSEVNETAGSVQFKCVASGVPASYTFLFWKHFIHGTWIRDIPEDTPNTGNGVSTLTLRQLSYETTGHYVCTVHNTITNAQGQLNQMSEADVTVVGTAKFQSVKSVSAELGSSVYLGIKLYSNPKVNSFTWTATESIIVGVNYESNLFNNTDVVLPFYGTDIILDGFEAQLIIHKLGRNDFRIYSLTVVNDIGVSSYNLNLSAAGAPETPIGFKSVSIQHSTVTVSWQSGFNGGYTQKFYLSYKEKSSALYNEETGFVDTGGIIEAVIQNLKPDTMYVFQVRAINERPGYNTSGFAHLEVTTTTESNPVTNLPIDGNPNAGAIAGGVVGAVAVVVAGIVVVIIYFERRGLIKCPQKKKAKSKTEESTNYDNAAFADAGVSQPQNTDDQTYEQIPDPRLPGDRNGRHISTNISLHGSTVNSVYNDLDQETVNEHEYSMLNMSRERRKDIGDSGYINMQPTNAPQIRRTEATYINVKLGVTEASEVS